MPALPDSLNQTLPPDRIFRRDADRAAYDADAQTAYRCRAAAAVIPRTTAELIAVVQWCFAESVPFVVRGSGTGLSAGATPVPDGLVIITTRLNRVVELDPAQRIAVVEAGIVNADVSRAAAAHGLFFAPDPSSQTVCTIGGNIGFNAGGAHCLKYGMTSNHVLGIKAVLASGEVVNWGGRTRDFVGPDWTGLFVGNEGLFGVVVEATLNLLPIPDGCHTVLAGFKSTEAAGDAVSAIIASGLVPVAMELMDDLTIEAVRPVVPINYPPDCHALLLIELDGPAAIVEAEKPQLEALLWAHGTTGIISAADATERANIWRVRKSSYSAFGRLAPNNFVQDSVVPRRHLGEALRRVNRIAAAAHLRCPNVCHAGDGNLHPNLLYDGEDAGAFHRAELAAAEILKMCVELGGSITGEHGVGLEKRAFLPFMFGPAELALFRQIHRAFDPAGIANPGKMLPPPDTTTSPLHPIQPDNATRQLAQQIAAQGSIITSTESVHSGDLHTSPLRLTDHRGIVAYEPVEFVLTARAGTPLIELDKALAEHGQQLPFDPPFVAAGATLGGIVATGLNGPGALNAGRLRDSILCLTFIDGRGQVLRVGAPVVKNVAGFDIPKLFVGSLGCFGVMTEITLKVCPRPPAHQTFTIATESSRHLVGLLAELAGLPARPAAIEAQPQEGRVWIRFDAPTDALPSLAESLSPWRPTAVPPDSALQTWTTFREFTWAPPDWALLKIPAGLDRVEVLLEQVQESAPEHRVLVGLAGDVLYVATPLDRLNDLRVALTGGGAAVLTLRGPGPSLALPTEPSATSRAIKTCFDPEGCLPPLPGTDSSETGV